MKTIKKSFKGAHLQIKYGTYTMRLDEMPLDIGYASDKVGVKGKNGKEHTIGGQNGKTQLIITAPFIDENLLKELREMEASLPNTAEHEVTASLVLAHELKNDLALAKFKQYTDKKEEFGDLYGVRLSGEPYERELTKAVFLISKDGALFYDEIAKDLSERFDQETLMRKIYAAQTCYTGKGCH
ncbi:hypothetical protein [Sulfurimonas sp. HSL-1716]|uniref:hypothetical protein n=1 Tax=Hydrocurvibacter sulfurireducens TaxID=3131937 RepID=UPI0031F73F55